MSHSDIQDLVVRLMSELDHLSLDHEEVTDTDVRESIRATLNYFFIWGQDGPIPSSFGMSSLEGDQAITTILTRFITEAKHLPAVDSRPVGSERLHMLQDAKLISPNGHTYDMFWGHVDEPLPSEPLHSIYFEPGD